MKDGLPQPIQNPTLILFLGLFLILLAFFIMLNSLSVVDERKSAAAVDSVTNQFGEAVFDRPVGIEIRVISEAAVAGGFHGQIESSFNAVLPVAEFIALPASNALQVTVPASSLFFTNEFRIRLPAEDLMDRLAATLTQAGTAETFEIEVVFEVAEDAAEEQRQLTRLRAGAFARSLVDRGVPPRRISAGVDVGEDAQVRMFFIARPGEPEKITLEPAP